MSDLVPNPPDTYGDSHDWRNEGTHQWGVYGGRARSMWRCIRCDSKFIHYYHDVPDIREAMRRTNVPDICEALKDEE